MRISPWYPPNPELLPADWLNMQPKDLAVLAPLQTIKWAPFETRGLRLSLKREDLLGYQLGGNKIYKLYGHLKKAQQLGIEKIASYGGAWSNHLLALATAGKQLGFQTLGLVRGQKSDFETAMISDARAQGMKFEYLDRAHYRQKNSESGRLFQEKINKKRGEHYWVPEGGGGKESLLALPSLARGIFTLSGAKVDVIAHACGTGASLAGIIAGCESDTLVIGFAVLKGAGFIENEVRELLRSHIVACPWELVTDWHCGGYAKLPGYLCSFMEKFERDTGVALDPIYTAKLMYGLTQHAEQGRWRAGTHIVAIHSGGLQGRRGWACFDTENTSNSIHNSMS